MMIPVRCFSCGKPIGHLWEEFKEKADNGEDRKKVLNSLNLYRYCCRATLMGQVDLIDESARFKKL